MYLPYMSERWKFLISITACILAVQTPVACADLGSLLGQPLTQSKTAQPLQLQPQGASLAQMIARQPYPSAYMQAIPLHGVNISGLQSKTVDTLGFNYFIVLENTKYSRMSDIYRESRLTGKSNFVTADSIVHPYLAFTNRVYADVALKQIQPDLLALLEAMQRVTIEEYNNKRTEDVAVREDLARNCAYLSVGLKLLNPRYAMPRIGNADQMAQADLEALIAGHPAASQIFDTPQDFSVFKPIGWYNSSPQLQNFYRCRQWLSEISYPIIDSADSEEKHSTNSFRRSVLLFHSLESGRVSGKPAMDIWQRLQKTLALLGTPVENWHERNLYPPDYKLVFQDRPADLKVTLDALAQPLYRTKLMLAVRRQKPMKVSSESIFEIDDGNNGALDGAGFRLFQVVCQPETRWFRHVAPLYPTDKQASASWPLGLLNMYAWGSPEAGNVLNSIMWTLDPSITKVLPDLVHSVMTRTASGQSMPLDNRTWKILETYFQPPREGAPGALRTELWGNRHLISAMGGLVDSLTAIAPPSIPAGAATSANTSRANQPGAQVATSPSTPSPSQVLSRSATVSKSAVDTDQEQQKKLSEQKHINQLCCDLPPTAAAAMAALNAATDRNREANANTATAKSRHAKVPPYHVLEPTLDLYKRLEADAQKTQEALAAQHCLSEEYRQRFGDFVRLFQRLEKIADAELKGMQIAMMDRRLLADIDEVLDRVDTPLGSVVPIESSISPEGSNMITGVNLATGRPGLLYIIYQNPANMEWTLGRGAVYTYYEMPAPLLTDMMWQHKLEAGLARPPIWSMKYEIVQQQEHERVSRTAVSRPAAIH